jgi:hypothetical protein
MVYVVIPAAVLVVDDCRTKTPSWVNTSSGYGDGSQVHQEHREPDWQRCQNLIKYNNTPSSKKNKKSSTNHILRGRGRVRLLTGTWESLALRLASVAENTV